MKIFLIVLASLVVGFAIGYWAHAMKKPTTEELEAQLTRLNIREASELVSTLEKSWGVSAAAPAKLVPDAKENK